MHALDVDIFKSWELKNGGKLVLIPVGKWLITMVIVETSPRSGCGTDRFQIYPKWLVNEGDPNHLRVLGSDPPSIRWDFGLQNYAGETLGV